MKYKETLHRGLRMLNATFRKKNQLHRGDKFYFLDTEVRTENDRLGGSQVIDKLFDINVVSSTPRRERVKIGHSSKSYNFKSDFDSDIFSMFHMKLPVCVLQSRFQKQCRSDCSRNKYVQRTTSENDNFLFLKTIEVLFFFFTEFYKTNSCLKCSTYLL